MEDIANKVAMDWIDTVVAILTNVVWEGGVLQGVSWPVTVVVDFLDRGPVCTSRPRQGSHNNGSFVPRFPFPTTIIEGGEVVVPRCGSGMSLNYFRPFLKWINKAC
jgi:hypothetical protein